MPHRSHPAVTALVVAALLSTISTARSQNATPASRPFPATETWVCTDEARSANHGRPPIELLLRDGLLIEQPLGTPRYELLVNNDHALIGVDHYGDFDPVLGMVNIFISTLTIDRSTGDFSVTTSVRLRVHAHRTGRCRSFEKQPSAGLAQRR